MLGSTEHKIHELEKLVEKQSSDIEALVTTINILKKKLDSMKSSNDSMELRLHNLEEIVDSGF